MPLQKSKIPQQNLHLAQLNPIILIPPNSNQIDDALNVTLKSSKRQHHVEFQNSRITTMVNN
jgi:hypothetical protein